MAVETGKGILGHFKETLFLAQQQEEIITSHHRRLWVYQTPLEIGVQDRDDPYYRMIVSLRKHSRLSFSLYTQKPIGFREYERHPDMYAAQFATHVIDCFEKKRQMGGIVDVWTGGEDKYGNYQENYGTWRAHMPHHIPDADEDTWLQAIGETWSAQLWATRGYFPDPNGYHFFEDDPEPNSSWVRVVYRKKKLDKRI